MLDYITTIIATAALLLTVFQLYWNRKKVIVEFNGAAEILGENSIYCRDEYNNFIQSSGRGPGLNLSVEIINSSPCDISYFDLRVFDPNTNANFFLITRNSLPEIYANKKIYRENLQNPLAPYHHCVPEGRAGMLKAHSLTYFDLFIIPKKESTKLRVSFRVAIRKNIFTVNDSFVTDNQKHLRYFTKNINIENWDRMVRFHLPLNTTLEDFTASLNKADNYQHSHTNTNEPCQKHQD